MGNEEYIKILQGLKDRLYFISIGLQRCYPRIGGTSLQREAIDKAIEALSQPELIHCMDCDW